MFVVNSVHRVLSIVCAQGYQGMVDGGSNIELAEWKTVSNIIHKVQSSSFIAGPPTHSVGGQTSNGHWCLLSSVTLAYAT